MSSNILIVNADYDDEEVSNDYGSSRNSQALKTVIVQMNRANASDTEEAG
jgi:hypothetical protein